MIAGKLDLCFKIMKPNLRKCSQGNHIIKSHNFSNVINSAYVHVHVHCMRLWLNSKKSVT